MPRYFFDVHNSTEATDQVGQVLPGLEAARQHALQVAADYAGNPEMLREDGGAIIVTARTVEAETVLTIRLAFSVELPKST